MAGIEMATATMMADTSFMAVALRFNVPAAAMKLVSAIIVAIAISMPAIKEKIAFEQRKHGACRRRMTTGKEGK